MKDTKFLFNELKQTPEGMISVSQLQSFLSCRKKWAYGYIEEITPRVEREFLSVGKLCHKGMQSAMWTLWSYRYSNHDDQRFEAWRDAGLRAMEIEWANYLENVPLLDEEIPEMEDTLKTAIQVFCQAFEEFEPWKYDVMSVMKDGMEQAALELHFVVPCPGSKGLHGFIDAILKDRETGFIWCTDYKFRKSLSPDEEEAYNIQNAVYTHACGKMGIPITGTMTWQHVNTPAADPAILKDGKISRAKIKTTWKHYEQFCRSHGQDPQDYYLEMEEKLRDIEWFRPTYEYRNPVTIKRIWDDCVVPVSYAIKSAHGKKAKNHRSLYPWNCKMCQFQSLCQAELRDYDAEAIRQREYVKRSHTR